MAARGSGKRKTRKAPAAVAVKSGWPLMACTHAEVVRFSASRERWCVQCGAVVDVHEGAVRELGAQPADTAHGKVCAHANVNSFAHFGWCPDCGGVRFKGPDGGPVWRYPQVYRGANRWAKQPSGERVATPVAVPIPLLLWCPECGQRHVDVGEFAHKPHHTHACQGCGHVWRPAVEWTVGVQFLPGYHDASIPKGGA